MNGTNTPQILTLLSQPGKTAAKMTHGLSVLGHGNMADGLICLWKNGQKNGIVKGIIGTSLVFTVGSVLYSFAKNKFTEYQAQQTLRLTCTTVEANEMPNEITTSKNSSQSTLERETLEV